MDIFSFLNQFLVFFTNILWFFYLLLALLFIFLYNKFCVNHGGEKTMANIKGQIKRNKQNEKARLANNSFKSSMKTAIKNVEVAVATKDIEKAKEAFNFACKKLDKAVAKGIKHLNYVSKKKSSLAKLVNTLV